MLWQLVVHNLLDSAKSLRFMLSFLVVVSAFILSGILFVSKYEFDVKNVWESEIENLRALEQKSKSLDKLATHGQVLQYPPPALGFVITGLSGHLPNGLYANAFGIGLVASESRTNVLLPRFNQLDWVFIIGILLSFVALTLTFDGISLEKEDGTLRLVMANAFPRYQFVLAKYAGALLVLMIPLTVGVLLNLIIVALSGSVALTSEHWVQILLVFGISVVYLSVFVLVGLLTSILTNRSSTSLALGLVMWVIMALIVPNLGKLITETFYQIPTNEELTKEIDLAKDDITFRRYPREAHEFVPTDRYRPSHQLLAQMLSEVVEAESKIRGAHRTKQLEQVRWGRSLARVSPVAVYQYSVESIADVGISRFLALRHKASNYREQLLEFVKSKDALDPHSPHWINPAHGMLYSNNPVDPAEIPKFQYGSQNLSALVRESMLDVLLLVIVNLILLTLSVASFLRFDVR